MFKTLISGLFLGLLLVSSCKKEDTVKDVITYELTLSAAKASTGSTVFTEIKYSDANNNIQTLTNVTNDFSVNFAITSGKVINFSVKGTATSAAGSTIPPSPVISYKVEKVTNGTLREVICNASGASVSGTNGNYTFERAYTKTFNGTDCQ